jgi:ethanolamine utilization protein EutL
MQIPSYLPLKIKPLPANLLSCRLIPDAAEALREKLGAKPSQRSLGLVTADQDDSLYAALDQATKNANVEVIYAKSFYAGSAHASGPLSGEILGVIASHDPEEVAEGLQALRYYLSGSACFYTLEDATTERLRPAFFPHVISETGSYLSALAGIKHGDPLAYLIAPPIEAMVAIDAALKSADVKLVNFFAPPSETNFGGAYLSGSLSACEAAAAAFAAKVIEVAKSPLEAARRPSRERR